jgi:hypothetical protein
LLLADNYEAKNLMCTYGEAFKDVVDVESSTGWEFVNEGNAGKQKWGFISYKPGSVLKVVVNSTRETVAVEGPNKMSVMLAYLKSYNKMGMAKFE